MSKDKKRFDIERGSRRFSFCSICGKKSVLYAEVWGNPMFVADICIDCAEKIVEACTKPVPGIKDPIEAAAVHAGLQIVNIVRQKEKELCSKRSTRKS